MPFQFFFDRLGLQLKGYWRSRDGNVGMIFALAAIPLVIAAGMGVDMARAYAMRVRLGAALDAAALAVGSSNPAVFTITQLQQRMQNYFNANYPASALGTPTAPVMTYQGTGTSVINFTATATIPTTFMRLINVKNLTVSVLSQVTRGASGLEVALVLDNTGSMMCGDGGSSKCSLNVPPTHMDTLRTDAQNIVNTLFAASTDPTKLKISIVPYVTAVNIGPAMQQSGLLNTYVPNSSGVYLDYKGNKILDGKGNNITYDSTQSQTSTEWLGCVVEATTANEDSGTSGPDMQEPAGGWASTRFTPYWWVSGNYTAVSGEILDIVNRNASTYRTYIVNTWVPHSLNSNGQVVNPTNPAPAANFLERDDGNYANEFSTAFGPQIDQTSAYAQSYGPNLGCPQPLVRLTSNQSALITAVQNLKSRANSGTAINIGMVWGWRTLSPYPTFGDGVDYSLINKGWIKAVVLETDGDAQVQDAPDYTGYGYIGDGKLGATSAGPLAPNTQPGTANYNMQNRLIKLCNNMKAANIVIYTIGLGDGASNTQLKSCATSPSNFYPAPTAASLTTAFQEIANSLNQLRLSK